MYMYPSIGGTENYTHTKVHIAKDKNTQTTQEPPFSPIIDGMERNSSSIQGFVEGEGD